MFSFKVQLLKLQSEHFLCQNTHHYWEDKHRHIYYGALALTYGTLLCHCVQFSIGSTLLSTEHNGATADTRQIYLIHYSLK